MTQKDDHWLSRPETIRRLWIVFVVILALTVLVQLVIPIEAHFRVDGWFAFAAVFGFGSCVLMILVAKALGKLLKRPDD